MPGFEQIGGANGPYVPTLNYSPPAGIPITTLVAGDADGDGIADSLLFRIPGASYDGLTWYAAIRIIDNNSAINLNTALSRDHEYTFGASGIAKGGNNYYSLFPTSVGLAEILNSSELTPVAPATTSNFDNFNLYRTGANAVATPAQADVVPGGSNPTSPVSRSDVQFLTAGDMLYNQLIRRINNPGFNGGGNRCRTLPLSDQASLAYHFCLVKPETTLSQVASSLTETFLPYSVLYYQAPAAGTPAKYYRSEPYGDSSSTLIGDVNTWFNDNFDYDNAPASYSATAGAQPIRSLLVTRNPVSNSINPVYDFNTANYGEPLDPLGAPGNPYAPPVAGTVPGMMLPYGMAPPVPTAATPNYTHFKGVWNNTQNYQFNDIVVGGDGYTYIYVNPPTSPAPSGTQLMAPALQNLSPIAFPGGLGLYVYWQFQPWTKSPQRANVNTATFRELYRAFWSVMAGNPTNQSPFGASVDVDPYWPDTGGTPPLTYNPQHQFRSPLRDPTYTNGAATSTQTRPGKHDAPAHRNCRR